KNPSDRPRGAGVPCPGGPPLMARRFPSLTSLVSTHTETKTVAPPAAGEGTLFRCGSPASPFEQEGAARCVSPRAGRLCAPSGNRSSFHHDGRAGPPSGPDTGSLCCATAPKPAITAEKIWEIDGDITTCAGNGTAEV